MRELNSAAVVLNNGALFLQHRDVPLPSAGCINIAVLRAGVCGTDPHLLRGDIRIPEPVVLGHEGLGQIVEIGAGVLTDHAGSPISIGDVVYWNPIRPCHSCYDCTVKQDLTACDNGTFWSPASNSQVWASYTQVATLLRNNAFYKVNTSVPLDAYIALGCALPTMLQATDNLGGIEPDSSIVVQGAGPVGLAAIMLSKLAGARHIVCIEGNQSRLKSAQGYGATELVDMSRKELNTPDLRRQHINRIVGDRGVGLVIECSGNANAFEEGIDLLHSRGKYLLVGTWAGSTKVRLSPFDLVRKALKIIGSTYCSPSSYYRAIKLIEANYQSFPFEASVTHKYELGNAKEALEDVAAGKVIKAVIYPQGIK